MQSLDHIVACDAKAKTRINYTKREPCSLIYMQYEKYKSFSHKLNSFYYKKKTFT